MTIDDRQVVEDRNDAEFIRRSRLWPNRVLPVKRRVERDLECGVILKSANDAPTRVFLTNMHAPDLKNCDVLGYESAEAAVADGWLVD